MTTLARLIATMLVVLHSARAVAPDYLSMNPSELRARLVKTPTGSDTAEFVKLAFESNRIELLSAAFEIPSTNGYYWERVLKMPDSPQLRELVLMMLRSESASAWPEGGGGYLGAIQGYAGLNLDTLVKKAVIRPTIDWSIIDTKDKRASLAQQLQTEFANTPLPQTQSKDSATPATERSTLNAPSVAPSPASTKAPDAKPVVPSQSEEPTASTPWSIIAVLIVAATGLLWLLVKNRK